MKPSPKRQRLVIGQYDCGCTYGPCRKSQRLEYCGIHGGNIQREYLLPDKKKE